MNKNTVPSFVCLKCGHHWRSLKAMDTGRPPVACPRCFRADWQKPRRAQKPQEQEEETA